MPEDGSEFSNAQHFQSRGELMRNLMSAKSDAAHVRLAAFDGDRDGLSDVSHDLANGHFVSIKMRAIR
jgi:hypothetical protein